MRSLLTLLGTLFLAFSFSSTISAQCVGTDVSLILTTGAWAEEISFSVVDEEGLVVFDLADYTSGLGLELANNSTYFFNVCLEDGCYTVIMEDTFGDGWNGAILNAGYEGSMTVIGTLQYGSYGTAYYGLNTEDCGPPPIPGCTHAAASNYNPAATVDDGSCIYPEECEGIAATVYICTFSNGNFVELEILDSEGNTVFTAGDLGDVAIEYFDVCLDPNECYTAVMSNSGGGTGWYNGYFWINSGGAQLVSDALDPNLSTESVTFGFGNACPYPGCTDQSALNYDPNATVDDGSCVYPEPCESNLVQHYMTVGGWPEEISWTLLDENDELVWQSNSYPQPTFFQNYTCLEDGCYTLLMFDSFGDGWNNALLSFTANGELVWQGTLASGDFSAVVFSINAEGCEQSSSYGCTDPSALNFNPLAAYDDGSCVYPVYGCTDPEASNYMPWATADNGSCVYPLECGEGEVLASLYVCTFSNGNQVELELMDSQNNLVYSVSNLGNVAIAYFEVCLDPNECYTVNMINNSGPFGWYNGYYWINVDGVQVSTGALQAGQDFAQLYFSIEGECSQLGCTDPNAINFDPNAVIDNGSCIYPLEGCTDPSALNWNPAATVDDGSCVYLEDCDGLLANVLVSTASWGYEISWELVDEFGTIVADGSGYQNNSTHVSQACLLDGCYYLNLYDSFGDGWNGGFISISVGNEILFSGTLSSGSIGNFGFGLNSDDCFGIEEIPGCIDPLALNYNPEATLNDGSCIYAEDCTDNALLLLIETQTWGYEISWDITDDQGNVLAEGSGYSSWSSYTEQLCLPDGCFNFNMYDSWGDGWNGAYYMILGNGQLYGEGSLFYGDSGMDIISINSECGLAGCTDSTALNYNPDATVDDGSCIFNGGINVDPLDFIQPDLDLDLDFFPNPFEVSVNWVVRNADVTQDLVLEVHDALGRLVVAQNFGSDQSFRQEVSNFENLESGLYLFTLRNGDRFTSVRMVKE